MKLQHPWWILFLIVSNICMLLLFFRNDLFTEEIDWITWGLAFMSITAAYIAGMWKGAKLGVEVAMEAALRKERIVIE